MVKRRDPIGSTVASARPLFLVYAAVSLIPVLLLGVVLLNLMGRQATSRGLAEGQAEASLLAGSVISPALGQSAPVGPTLTSAQQARVERAVAPTILGHRVVRLRIRDLESDVVWSDDGSGFGEPVDGEALDAASGVPVVDLTKLDADEAGDGAGHDAGTGPRVVEAYVPILAHDSARRIGVLEVYLPYRPIAADVSTGQHIVGLTLLVGLLLLWAVLLGVSASVSRRIRRAATVNAYLASHDVLTGLPNRARFEQLAADRLAESTSERPVVVAVLDLDRFKQVNDTLGYGNGDVLLSQIADRLGERLRERDLLARLGGNGFGIALGEVHGPSEAVEVLNRLREAVNKPLMINGLPLALEASVGFALGPDDGDDTETLLTRAEIAMYVAKDKHLGVVHFHPEHNRHDAATLGLVAELGDGIAADQLVLHYQPKTELRSGRITAVEALVRWNHPTRGLLYPDAFLPAAEQTELVDPLTAWVLRRALQELPSFDSSGQLDIAVNVSARSLAQDDFADGVLAIIASSGIDPTRVIIEVTETALVTDARRAEMNLTRLDEAGVRVSIDDFGAGQTSLAYLASLPVTELKIDKGFVIAMTHDLRNAAIVRSIIELGHSLGLTVTAEGVETVEILDELTVADCDLVQGYLLSRPLTADKLREHLMGERVTNA
ncbi:MAG TPA: bifunctional diguanylate cyclase/phosphodiesterase [Mycobacteriales bacterium]|jgi:diguanylate cyclase (GGDEF)-like protein|nr:bifunctional diguanylate cyclase/phosphodiesterase [Mycobacteriales bacterium]